MNIPTRNGETVPERVTALEQKVQELEQRLESIEMIQEQLVALATAQSGRLDCLAEFVGLIPPESLEPGS